MELGLEFGFRSASSSSSSSGTGSGSGSGSDWSSGSCAGLVCRLCCRLRLRLKLRLKLRHGCRLTFPGSTPLQACLFRVVSTLITSSLALCHVFQTKCPNNMCVSPLPTSSSTLFCMDAHPRHLIKPLPATACAHSPRPPSTLLSSHPTHVLVFHFSTAISNFLRPWSCIPCIAGFPSKVCASCAMPCHPCPAARIAASCLWPSTHWVASISRLRTATLFAACSRHFRSPVCPCLCVAACQCPAAVSITTSWASIAATWICLSLQSRISSSRSSVASSTD